MRKRRSNKGALIAVIASLSTVSVVSVGFASWLITGGAEETIDASIVANEFTDSRYLLLPETGYVANDKIIFTTANENNAIVFGPKTTGTNFSDPWLTVGANDQTEALVGTTYFWVGNASGSTVQSNFLKKGNTDVLKIHTATVDTEVVSNTDSTTHAAAYAACVSSNLVGALPTPALEVVKENSAEVKKTVNGVEFIKVKATITFAWGTHFGTTPVNPYSYYNGLEENDTNKDDARDSLTAIYKLNGASYSVKIQTGEEIE